jgi:hypothetical protein
VVGLLLTSQDPPHRFYYSHMQMGGWAGVREGQQLTQDLI